MAASTSRRCKDCVAEGIETNRPVRFSGPRCTSHHRAFKARTKKQTHARRVESTYGITTEQYWEIYELQGRVCAICRRATGATKNLAVDHEHHLCEDHPPSEGCPRCVRGLLCGPCNYTLLGRFGQETLQRAIDYLTNPPARKVL